MRQRQPRMAGEVTLRDVQESDLADTDENMKAIPRKQRAMVRKGIKAGLVSEIDHTVSIGSFRLMPKVCAILVLPCFRESISRY